MQKLSSLTVFFPVYNEEKNVEEMVHTFQKVLPTVAKKWEIVIINDGSSDGSAAVSERLEAEFPEQVRVVHHHGNKGYGAALRSGFATARYDWTFFTDGDLQFDAQQITKLVEHSEKSEVVIGYRKRRAEGGIRAFNASLFKLFVDILFRLHVRDIDCAFKLFKTEAIRKIELTSSGALISTELLYKLKKEGYQFVQVPVDHFNRRHGSPTGAAPKVILKAMVEFVRLYLSMKKQYLTKK